MGSRPMKRKKHLHRMIIIITALGMDTTFFSNFFFIVLHVFTEQHFQENKADTSQ